MMDVSGLPGFEAIRLRFLKRLNDKIAVIQDAFAAMTAHNNPELAPKLALARDELHMISGSAGSLGMVQIGDQARLCENLTIAFLDRLDPDIAEMQVQYEHFISLVEYIQSK